MPSKRLLRSIEDNGPFWAQDSVVVQDVGNETGCVLGVGYDGDLVCDSAVRIRILRGRRFCRAGGIVGWCGVEEALGLLLDTQRTTGQSAQLGTTYARHHAYIHEGLFGCQS